jgi:hypothetical protein
MPVAKPSPAPRARAPEMEVEPTRVEADSESEPELAAVAEELSTPDWLEPLSPMPGDVPKPEPTPRSVEPEAEPEIEAAPLELDLDLEEVIAEDTQPPTPVRTRGAEQTVVHALAEPEPEPEAEPEVAEEVELGMDADGEEFSLGALVSESADDSEEEAALAGFGPAADPEAEADLAPVRRTAPIAKPSPMARPVTPAGATPAKATPAKAAPGKATPPKPMPIKPTPARPTPAKPSPAMASNGDDDGFDLRNLMVDEETDAGVAPLKPPAKDSDDDDLDALFDEIQLGDK